MDSLRSAIIILALVVIASAAQLKVSIPPSQLLPNPSTLPSSSHAILLGPPGIRYDAPIRRDNTFIFADLPDESYLLTLHARDYFFPPLRVDIVKNEGEASQNISAWQTFRGNEWSNKGPSFGTGKDELTITVRPAAEKQFYQVRGGFNVLSFLKSPMILMGLVSVGLVFGMPYLMANSALINTFKASDNGFTDMFTVDEDAKAEFEEMSKNSPLTGSTGAASQMQNFDLAGFLAGRSNDAEKPAAPSSGKKK